MQLPENIEGLIKAQNEFDSNAFAAYFTEQATVFDEGSSYSGRDEIRDWIQQATEKYKMQLKAVDFLQTGSKGKLTVEVAGTFPGSPALMQYHLELNDQLISSLKITA
ncbi:nuclear transport factor 2 family protein [Dyadobacter subterraneus]|uniref:Nuclear transport factor 2 family protein n=1 Tax=Dyadobacter subterraneus TaxID=2773304 RepID=A0ABR9WEF0_9BACT|nr:nuclear transport factor 2 family protein [Dyadobacter subterraneus]MBE9463872.1 nuclear transport factor 2 family protein [Dyadobacter subterraneus]